MPRTPKATDGEAPKKRTRKAAAATENSTKVTAKSAEAPKKAVEEVAVLQSKTVVTIPSIEERIRARAYELYLRRNGMGGSPEQDWFQAVSEIYQESVA
jgi:hypothetical protein